MIFFFIKNYFYSSPKTAHKKKTLFQINNIFDPDLAPCKNTKSFSLLYIKDTLKN